MILRTTHKPPVQSLLIIRLKTSTFETKMETVGALPAPDVILPTTIIHLFGIVSENGLELSRPKSYSLWTHRVVTKVLTVSVLDIGQHRPWSTSSTTVVSTLWLFAGHYFRDNQLCFLCLEKKERQRTAYGN